jgi:hypothetical protein
MPSDEILATDAGKRLKNIRELTELEGKQIVAMHFEPIVKSGRHYSDGTPATEYWFERFSFEPKILQGRQQVTFNGRSIIGIEVRNHQRDGFCLYFDDDDVKQWLDNWGYDTSEEGIYGLQQNPGESD